MASPRAQWGSRVGFILAAAGSAVGLGNIWKFPYITGENGGGLFVIIYLVCIALVGIPIMMAEIMIGRAAQAQPVVAFERLQGRRTAWAGVGWLGVLAGFVILSYYVVVAGWAMDYTLKSVVNFTKPIHERAEIEGAKFRASATTGEMQLILITDMADRELKKEEAKIRAKAKPSAWREYDRYTAALAQAGAVDVGHAGIVAEVWADTPPQTLRLLSGVDVLPAEKASDQPLSEADVPRLLNDVLQSVDRLAAGQSTPADPFQEARTALLGNVRRMVGRIELDRPEVTPEARALYEETRGKLLEEDVRVQIEQAETLMKDIENARKAKLLEARAHFDAYPDAQMRSEAEDLFRRAVIFAEVDAAFTAVASDGWTCSFWSAIFMLLVILIVAGGIASGIERTCRILMPTLFVLILVMVIYGAFQRGFGEAVLFVFKPDPTKLKASGVLEALGHAFFTLSLGMGAMITYGSYQQTKEKLASQSITIAVLDTVIALLACLMIFPIVFSYGQEPAAGPGLVFKSMPLAFAEIGKGGMLLAILFFGLVVFAAVTSAISLLEVVASYFIDQLAWPRRKAAWVLGVIIMVLGLASAFAVDPNFAMDGWQPSFGKNFFDTLDYLATNWMLPTGGLFIALYAGWAMPKRLRDAELQGLSPLLISIWLLLVRFIAPALVIVVLLQKVGILDADEVFHGLFN